MAEAKGRKRSAGKRPAAPPRDEAASGSDAEDGAARPRFSGGQAALDETLWPFAEMKYPFKYGEKGRASPLKPQKILVAKQALRSLKKLQDNMCFTKKNQRTLSRTFGRA